MTNRAPSEQPQKSEDGGWPQRLGRISTAVEAWRRRAEDPQPPEPQSSLATDSIEGLNVENLIWYSMCISSEHLDFALDAMRATSTMYPTAYMTVARTAFVAAVNTVWVLAPSSRQQRRERALELRADDLRAQVTSFRNMRIPKGVSEDARTEFVEQIRERQAHLQKVATTLGMKQDVTKIRFNQTNAIDWVAEHMHGVGNDLLIAGTQFVWRSGSAAAHAQYHFGIMRMDRSEAVREDSGSSVVRLRGDLETDVGPALAAATLTLSEAFRLYDLRRVRHDVSAGAV
ncbi:hypothetical protein [Microbacterium candidum]|uniref:Uncharacterized protein n=1 Tax=Microbacterium candidum TaxID=3041922 RepID=A0ABT7N037_9MICO|nr:hypothetical protein [Microbacterium sp. ASV49]MDL9980075.1 hypothetical protein [Microbacterium sp. ASV49]